MRIFFMGNNRLGWQIADWLGRRKEDEIVGVALHPRERRQFGKEIVSALKVKPSRLFDAARLNHPSVVERIKKLRPEVGVSVLLGTILKKEFLSVFPKGCVNLHPAYLPYNRGAYPNVWSIVERTPAGATLHYIDEGVDTGRIIRQRRLGADAADTGKTLYHKLERLSLNLFKDTWPLIRRGKARSLAQHKGKGTSHRVKDAEKIDRIDLDTSYKARDLLNILRARTFLPYRGAYFMDGRKKVYLRLELIREGEPG